MKTIGKENSNQKSLPKNSDSSKEKNIGNKLKNINTNKKSNNNYIILAIILKPSNNDLIDNNVEKNKGIVELIDKINDKIKIKKELLKNINSFIACIGQPGVGKSSFGSNYYKKLYKVKND